MTAEELSRKIAEVTRKCELEKDKLRRQYAEENCSVKVGDIVTDYFHSIRVEKIKFHFSGGEPQMVFHGIEVKKDGTPYKRQTDIPVYQCNLKSVNGKEYKKIVE